MKLIEHAAPFDLLRLDDELTADQKAYRDRVRDFVDREVMPCAGEAYDQAQFPKTWLRGLADLGVMELFVSGNPDPMLYGLASRELERGGSPLRSVVSVQGGLTMTAIALFGSDEHKARWLGPLGRLDEVGCFCLTEPRFGSNPSGMETTATRTSTGFRLAGHKRWATNATVAQVAVIWAKLDDQVRGFVVETDRPGVVVKPIKHKWSFRASESAEIELNGVELPESALLPGTRSVGSALKCLNSARYGIAWGVVGAASACLEETLGYLGNRPQFAGKPITAHQLVQNKLAWMATELAGMDLIVRRLAELRSRGKIEPVQVSIAKMNNCRKALDIARSCRDLLGANGITVDYHVGRRMVDLETVVTYEGTEHIHALIIGQHLTGQSAFA
jgi:glutaryl-CoA dehydrogenase